MAKKLGVHIDIIPNMYDLGLFKKSLSSRKRLRLTALAGFLGLCGIYLGSGIFIRYFSTNEWLNIILILISLLCSIGVAYIVALVVGDIIFHGPWREKMIKGGNFVPDDIEDQKALLKNKSFYFILAWVFSIVILCFGCDLCTGSNIRWYQNVGSTLISMKSSDVNSRRFIIKTISNAYYSQKWADNDIRENVRILLQDEDSEVQSWAAYLAGRAKLVEGTDDLIELAKSSKSDPHARTEAIIALGRMEWKPARPAIFSVMKTSFTNNHADKDLVPSCLYSFYMMKDPMAAQETIKILDTCLETRDCSSEILQYAFFYLKSLHVKEASKLSFKYLDVPDISEEMRCYASDILRFTATKSDVPRLKNEFKKAGSSIECPVVYRKYHEEPAVIMFEKNPLNALFLRSVGNIMDPADYDWIWMIGSNTSENMQTRKVAETYTRAMQEKGLVK